MVAYPPPYPEPLAKGEGLIVAYGPDATLALSRYFSKSKNDKKITSRLLAATSAEGQRLCQNCPQLRRHLQRIRVQRD